MYTLLCHNYYEFIIMSNKQITEHPFTFSIILQQLKK